MKFKVLILFLLCGWCSSAPVYAAQSLDLLPNEPVQIVGSYLNEGFAQARQEALAAEQSLQTWVLPAMVGGIKYHRVIYRAEDAAQLRAAQRRLAGQGTTDTWISSSPGGLAVATPQSRDENVASRVQESRTAKVETPEISAAISANESTERITASNDVSEIEPSREPIGTIQLSTDGTAVDITLPQYAESAVEVRLDGKLEEDLWREIPGYDNLVITDPDTMLEPRYETVMKAFYTDKGMYIGVRMEQPPETLLARLSSRDEFLNRDSWGITLDTSGEGLYGYWFTVNLGGSVMDGKVAAERQYTNQWDGPWQSATAELSDGWSTELFLPWSMMTMPDSEDGKRNFGFWVNRKVAHLDERWTWPALPFTSTRFMSVLGKMQTPGVDPGQQFEVFPNVSYTLDEIDNEDEYRVGMDLSWRPSSNLQLTATLNPDFGVVESDDVVVNLSAFETFFPEKRLFFLEGSEVFQTTPRSRVRSGSGPSGSGARRTTSTFNPEPTTLLNTRRIGGPPRVDIPDNVDVAGVDQGKPSDLLGAVKLTGQKGGFRYGVLGAFEDDNRLPGTVTSGPNAGTAVRVEGEGRDFGVARLLYETTGAGRQSVGYLGTMVRYSDYDATVHGVDAHWLSPNGLWQLDGQLMHSDVEDVTGGGALADITFKPRQGVEHKLTLDYLDDTLNVRDLGFIRRNDSQNVIYRYSYRTGRGLKYLRAKSRSVVVSNEWNTDGRQVRGGYFFRNGWTFKNRGEIRTEFDYFPARWDDRNSRGNGDFRVEDRMIAEVGYGTDTSKKVSVSALIGARQEELSDWTIRSALGVTFKPNDRFSIEFDVNYFDRGGWLLHQSAFGGDDPLQDRNMTTYTGEEIQPRIATDLFLSAKQQLRLTLQWAGINVEEQEFYEIPLDEGDLVQVTRGPTDARNDFTVSRMTAQLRYRWEIGPLSDLFVVYTRGSSLPNRMDDDFGNLFRDAIDTPIVDVFVVKLRYRFGL